MLRGGGLNHCLYITLLSSLHRKHTSAQHTYTLSKCVKGMVAIIQAETGQRLEYNKGSMASKADHLLEGKPSNTSTVSVSFVKVPK